MPIQLMRASQKISSLRVELAKVDLQSDLLQEIIHQKCQEALSVENDIDILQGKLQGIREIGEIARVEFEKCWVRLAELRINLEKENDSTIDECDPKKMSA